ncbi:MAG: hypothetical protein NC085_10415 [Muribaculaceae bacterium]|nr:hypothetical protein [Muribaculaceae bacterium]
MNGYEDKSNTMLSPAELLKWNNSIIKSSYEKHQIDYIDNVGTLSYDEFKKIKNNNNLSLSRVNELHSDIKLFIEKTKTNVSTKYLADYMGYFSFIRNWRVANGHYPKSKFEAHSDIKRRCILFV